ncbi:hypothetical protein QBC40DRAFT_226570 [Triangularia verruculosa]|uniref:Uncharacterized protein n=1 Tax=Triangularia verruculosa TaxID=2587418 RepID=A0AAN6XKD5_9PEZI|nr:hypothetical protein QBC40DRAFT_226570 [Triangularia verruculosa]
MSSFFLTTGLVAAFLVCGIQAHVVMNTPKPYGLHSGNPLLRVSPLDGITNTYPCQSKNFECTAPTVIEAGNVTKVNFTGGAQHGGGSCQFSITYDTPENGRLNENTKFKTIYTIIGGCPAVFTNGMQNLPAPYHDAEQRQDTVHCNNDRGNDCMRNFLVPFPKFPLLDLSLADTTVASKNGPAVFAWTWFNKIGNREMYMNCAPINITGGTGSNDNMTEFNSLPDIFIANYPGHTRISNCSTGDGESQVLNIPNPGRYGRLLEDSADLKIKPNDYCSNIPPAASLPSFEPNNLTSIVAVASPSGSVSSGTVGIVYSTVAPTLTMGSVSLITTVLTTTTTSPVGTKAVPLPTESVTNPLPFPGKIPIPKPAPNAVPCTKEEGELVCLGGGLQQGLCSYGWVIPQPVAMRTVCDLNTGRIVLASRAVKWRRGAIEERRLQLEEGKRGIVPA